MSTLGARPTPWMTAEEAAPYLATTAHSLRRLARTGNSPIVTRRVGSRWLFSRADLARFCDPDDADGDATTTPRRDDHSASSIQVRPLVVGSTADGSDTALWSAAG